MDSPQIAIVPQPDHVSVGVGEFVLAPDAAVFQPGAPTPPWLRTTVGVAGLDDEGYRLDVGPDEPIPVASTTSLAHVYEFEPVPAGLDPSLAHHVIGSAAVAKAAKRAGPVKKGGPAWTTIPGRGLSATAYQVPRSFARASFRSTSASVSLRRSRT